MKQQEQDTFSHVQIIAKLAEIYGMQAQLSTIPAPRYVGQRPSIAMSSVGSKRQSINLQ